MDFVPSEPPWFVASPLGIVHRLASKAEVSAHALGPMVGLAKASNFNVTLGIAKSNRKDRAPTAHCEHWTWLGAGSSMPWIQKEGTAEYVPIIGGTAAWFTEHFRNRRADLEPISAQYLGKLLASNATSHGYKTSGIGARNEPKWLLVDAPNEPVEHVRLFISTLDGAGRRTLRATAIVLFASHVHLIASQVAAQAARPKRRARH